METVLKERKITLSKKQRIATLNKRETKKQLQGKNAKLLVDYSNQFAVFNMQEDEDAAVRADVWN